jgi:hypothetical protein
MITNRAILLITTLILLTLTACLPQSDPGPIRQDANTPTVTQADADQMNQDNEPAAPTQVATASATVPPTATIRNTATATETTPPTPTPSATIMLEEKSLSLTPEPIEEVPLTMQPTVPNPANPAIEGWITLAKDDLATRLAVSVNDIELISFEAKIWPDGGLGCPQPGLAHKQVPVDGYLISLRVGKQVYDYQGRGGRPPFLCEEKIRNGDPSVPSPGFNT